MPNERKITEIIDQKAFDQFDRLKKDLQESQNEYMRLVDAAMKFNQAVGSSNNFRDLNAQMDRSSKTFDEVIKGTDELTQRYRKLREEQNNIIQETEKNIKAQSQAGNEFMGFNKQLDETAKRQARLALTHKELRAEINRLRKEIIKSGDATGELSEDLTELTQRDSLVNEQLKDTNRELNRRAKIQNLAEDSSQRMALVLDQLRSDYNRLTQEQKDNAEIGGKMREEILRLDAVLKQSDASIGVFNRNVGNYTQASGEVVDVLGQLFPQLNAVNAAYKQGENVVTGLVGAVKSYVSGTEQATTVTKGQTVATKASANGFKILRAAIISTGIGALIVALGSLIAYFTTTQEGIDKVTKVTRPLAAIFSRLTHIASQVGKSIVEAFTNPQNAVKRLWEVIRDNLVNRLTALGGIFKSIQKIITSGFREGYKDLSNSVIQMTTGVENAIDKMGDAATKAGKELKDAWQLGEARDNLIKEIEEIEITQTTLMGRLRRDIQEQRNIARDARVSDTERREAAEKAVALINQQEEENNRLIQKRIELVKLEQQISGDASLQSRKELAELQAQIDENAASAEQQRGRVVRSDNSLAKSMQKNAKDTAAKQKKLTDQQNELLKKMNEIEELRNRSSAEIYRKEAVSQQNSLEDRIQFLEMFSQKQIEIIDNQFAEEARLAKIQYADNQDLLDAQLEIIAQKRRDAGVKVAEQVASTQKEILGTVSAERIEDEIKTVERLIEINRGYGLDVTNEELKLAELRDKLREQRTKKEEKADKEDLQRKKQLFDAQKQLMQELSSLALSLIQGRMDKQLDELALEKEKIEQEREDRLAQIDAEAENEDEARQKKAVAEAQFNAQQRRIEQQERRIKQKQALADRVAQTSNIIGNTAVAVAAALPNIPLSITVGAIGAAQLAQLLATPLPKYAKGTNSSGEGWAITGERGHELMIGPSGNVGLSQDKASLTYLQKGTQVIPAHETKRILAAQSLPQDREAGTTFDLMQMMIESKKQNKDLIKAINSKKSYNTILTKRGLRKEHGRNSYFYRRKKELI